MQSVKLTAEITAHLGVSRN